MNQFYDVIKNVPLFYGIKETELTKLLTCLRAKKEQYAAGEVIFAEGGQAELVGVVLNGKVQIVTHDFYGNRTIVATVFPGQLFGEAFACAGVQTLPISAIAANESDILLIDYRKIITTCSSACVFHNRMIQNMLKIVADKNLILNQKIEIISKRSTKEKLIAYLLAQAKKQDSDFLTIPFNRQELADYLCVDRSAMTTELGKLRREGKLEFYKNTFKLL